ncbi:hypothetical protein Bra1253DRAFT_00162 [Bradyrhizobium sp. WSM1253]|nr:hypothetical protein Bra1253DRAFT_00162 [Bradyrhizobium sp. WSM1253]
MKAEMYERAPASFAERVCGYTINASVRTRGHEQHGPAALPIGPQHWFMDSTRSTDRHAGTSRHQNSGRQREHSIRCQVPLHPSLRFPPVEGRTLGSGIPPACRVFPNSHHSRVQQPRCVNRRPLEAVGPRGAVIRDAAVPRRRSAEGLRPQFPATGEWLPACRNKPRPRESYTWVKLSHRGLACPGPI